MTSVPASQSSNTVQTASPVSGDGSSGSKITIAGGAIPLSDLATQTNNTVVGNVAGTASPVALTAAQLTVLINPATSSLPGALTAAQFLQLQQVGPFVSATIDLTATPTGVVIAPAVTGKSWITHRIGVFQTVATGALSTAATIRIGNNATPTNVFAAANTLTNSTAFNLGVGNLTLSASVGQAVMVQSAATVCDVTIAATGTGGFAYSVEVILFGGYI